MPDHSIPDQPLVDEMRWSFLGPPYRTRLHRETYPTLEATLMSVVEAQSPRQTDSGDRPFPKGWSRFPYVRIIDEPNGNLLISVCNDEGVDRNKLVEKMVNKRMQEEGSKYHVEFAPHSAEWDYTMLFRMDDVGFTGEEDRDILNI